MEAPEKLALVARIVVGIFFFVGATAFNIAGLVTHRKMVDEVNALLPERSRFAHLWWHPWKYARLLREYARLFPTGLRIRELQWRRTGGFIGMALVVLAICPGVCGIVGALFFAATCFLTIWIDTCLILRRS